MLGSLLRPGTDHPQVAAGREGAPGPGENDRTQLIVPGQLEHLRRERLPHGLGHGVPPLGVVEGQNRHAPVALEEDQRAFGHGASVPETRHRSNPRGLGGLGLSPRSASRTRVPSGPRLRPGGRRAG